MDIQTYRRILAGRGEDPDGEIHGENRGRVAFATDLLNNKAVWYNDRHRDWHAYLKLNHPLYSVCKAPEQHPFSRGERLVLLQIGLCLAVSWSYATTFSPDAGCADDSDVECEGDQAEQIGWAIVGSVVKMTINILLQFLATCPFCQKKGSCLMFKTCFERIGRCFIILWTLVIGLVSLALLILAATKGVLVDMLWSFTITLVGSWVMQVVWLSIQFHCKWSSEKHSHAQLMKLEVNYVEYEKLEHGRDVEGLEHLVRQSVLQQGMPVREQVPSNLAPVAQQQVVYVPQQLMLAQQPPQMQPVVVQQPTQQIPMQPVMMQQGQAPVQYVQQPGQHAQQQQGQYVQYLQQQGQAQAPIQYVQQQGQFSNTGQAVMVPMQQGQYVQQGQPSVRYSVAPMQQQPPQTYVQGSQPVYVPQQQQVEHAATKIQALWRGKQARSNMNQYTY